MAQQGKSLREWTARDWIVLVVVLAVGLVVQVMFPSIWTAFTIVGVVVFFAGMVRRNRGE